MQVKNMGFGSAQTLFILVCFKTSSILYLNNLPFLSLSVLMIYVVTILTLPKPVYMPVTQQAGMHLMLVFLYSRTRRSDFGTSKNEEAPNLWQPVKYQGRHILWEHQLMDHGMVQSSRIRMIILSMYHIFFLVRRWDGIFLSSKMHITFL